jgi:hypothetical protein
MDIDDICIAFKKNNNKFDDGIEIFKKITINFL